VERAKKSNTTGKRLSSKMELRYTYYILQIFFYHKEVSYFLLTINKIEVMRITPIISLFLGKDYMNSKSIFLALFFGKIYVLFGKMEYKASRFYSGAEIDFFLKMKIECKFIGHECM